VAQPQSLPLLPPREERAGERRAVSVEGPAEVVDTRGRFLHRRPTAPDEETLAHAWNYDIRPMKRPEIVSALKELLRAQKQVKVDIDALGEETPLSQVGFDSISILDFMYDVESRFNVRTDIAELVSMDRIKDLIDHLERKLAG
jgi:acyl carrier protein